MHVSASCRGNTIITLWLRRKLATYVNTRAIETLKSVSGQCKAPRNNFIYAIGLHNTDIQPGLNEPVLWQRNETEPICFRLNVHLKKVIFCLNQYALHLGQ